MNATTLSLSQSFLWVMKALICLVFIRALRPFKVKKYRLENHPNYKYTAEADKSYLRPNPYLLEYCDEEIELVRVKAVGGRRLY
ncbi:MAG: hypothetical protein IKL49_09675 [Lachnospiraceae bacterium]|nr:hypothetical protein [Lachnospiraceae bacterium]